MGDIIYNEDFLSPVVPFSVCILLWGQLVEKKFTDKVDEKDSGVW